jgi:peptide/nickel transport system substrate-binding protein
VFGFDPGLPPAIQDVDGARRLLAEAGVPAGCEVELEFREDRNARPIQLQLATAGLRVRLRPRPWKEMVGRLLRGEASFYYGAFAADTGDAGDILRSLLGGAGSGGAGALLGYSSPELDRLLAEADRAAGVRERRSALERAMKVAMRDLPLVPLMIPEDLYGVGPRVEWTPRPDGRFDPRELRRRRSHR